MMNIRMKRWNLVKAEFGGENKLIIEKFDLCRT